MTTYRVNITHTDGRTIGAVKVQAEDKAAAGPAAVALIVEHAKAYNAKYGQSFLDNGVAWAMKDVNPAGYRAGAARKVAVRAGA